MMKPDMETFTPGNIMTPIGPYSHISRVNDFITIGGTAGVDPKTEKLAGPDISTQTLQILESFELMLESVNSDLEHVLHINVFLMDMDDFAAMNAAYSMKMKNIKPPRTAISVSALPKKGALVTMNLTAVTRNLYEDKRGS